MMDKSSYLDGWKKVVCDGVMSYIDVLKRLKDSKEYHKDRSTSPFDDGGAGGLPDIRIPLLWGTF